VEILSALAREAHDETGPNCNAWDGPADAFDQLEEDIAAPAALHTFQHARARVLQRHVDILCKRRLSGDSIEQPLGYFVGIRIEEANPLLIRSLDLCQPRQQVREAVSHSKVFAVAGGVLADQVDL